MSQQNPEIAANQTGLQYRTQDNAGKVALMNHHKGATAPSYAAAGIIWIDDAATPWLMKVHDGTDWITIASINATTNAIEMYHGAAGIRLLNHAADTGLADAYVVAPSPVIAAYATGQIVTLKPANVNTGASTINVNGLGVKSIKTVSGADPAAGELATAGIYTLVYDGTNFVVTNVAKLAGEYLNYAADTGAADAYVVAPSPAITAYATGQIVKLKPANANTGASTINVNGLGIKSIKNLDGTAIAANTLLTTGTYPLIYNGTDFNIMFVTSSASNEGGSTTTSSGANVTLTSASTKLQIFTATTYGLSVVLPNATTLSLGQSYSVKNAGTYTFTIIDNAGNVKGVVNAGETVTVRCSSISTAAGVWHNDQMSPSKINDLIHLDTLNAVTYTIATNTNKECFTPISDTTALVLYWDNTATAAVKACVVTSTGEGLSLGAITTIEALAAVSELTCIALDSTHVLISYSTTATHKVMVLSISGTTVTANAAVVVAATSTDNIHLFYISSTSAYLGYSTGVTAKGVVITVSGTTPTVNAITSGFGGVVDGTEYLSVCQLSATAYFYAYRGTTNYLGAQVFTVSGTTVTANAAVANMSISVTQDNIKCVAVSATTALIVSRSSTTINLWSVTISGTTINNYPETTLNIFAGIANPTIRGIIFTNGRGIIFMTGDTNGGGAYRIYMRSFYIDQQTRKLMLSELLSDSISPITTNTSGNPSVGLITTLTGKYGLIGRNAANNGYAIIPLNFAS